MILIAKAELLQAISVVEEVAFKFTLVTVTTTAIIRFIAIDALDTIQRLREEKEKRLRKTVVKRRKP